MKLGIRKIIAIAITLVFCFVAIYGFITGKASYQDITVIVMSVISYYFGKSTALDMPGKTEKEE